MKKNKILDDIESEEFDDIKDYETPIDELIDTLNMARADWYKLYKKDFKVASIRLRKKLEFVIQTSKQMKRDALKHRKMIEESQRRDDSEYIYDESKFEK